VTVVGLLYVGSTQAMYSTASLPVGQNPVIRSLQYSRAFLLTTNG